MNFVIIEGDVTLRSAGVELATADGVAVVAGARGFIGVGYDGTNTRFIRVDSSGYQVMVGAGTAGTPAGGVVSVQGVSGGQALPISAASLPLPSGAATEATLASIDGNIDVAISTRASEATLATLLTESTFTTRVPVLVAGGGTEATALRVTIASDSTGLLSVDDNGGSLTTDTPQLPAALVGGRLDANLGAWMGSTAPTIGQKTGANSIPVVIASDQSAIPVSQSGTWTVQQGTPPWDVQTEVQLDYDTGAGSQSLSLVGLGLPASGGAVAGGTATDPIRTDPTGTTTQPVSDAGGSLTVDDGGGVLSIDDNGGSLTVDTPQLPAALVGGRLDVVVGTELPAGTQNIGDVDVVTVPAPLSTTGGGTEATALRVTIANDSTGLVSVDDNGGSLSVDDGGNVLSVDDAGGSLTVDTPQLPAALVGSRLDTNIGAWMGATTPTVGQKAMVASIPVVIASDQTPVDVAQSGTWTVQQGTPPWTVAGTDADGAAPTENPVLTAGQDGTNVQSFKTDTTGRQEVIGGAADGATPAGNPVLVAGQDGTNVQSLKTDTVGRPEAVGAAANGVAVAGAPVRVGGSDGTLTRDLLTDTSGRQQIVGAAADGAAVTGNPVLVGGQDGTDAQSLLVDTSGRPRIVGAASDGAAAAGDPVQVAGVDGSGNVQSVLTETDGAVRTRNDFQDDRDKIVGLSFYKEGVTATTYYMGIDLSNTTDFKHSAGTGIRLVTSIGKALKSNIGAQWAIQLMVILRIDGTDSDLAVLAQASLSLQDTSRLSILEQVVDLWPHVANLTVSGGAFTNLLTNLIETNVAAINTGVTVEDAAGNTPTPAVGDLLIRADLQSGSGTLDFAYGLHYWVE